MILKIVKKVLNLLFFVQKTGTQGIWEPVVEIHL